MPLFPTCRLHSPLAVWMVFSKDATADVFNLCSLSHPLNLGSHHCSSQQNTAEGMLIQPGHFIALAASLLPVSRNTYS